MFTTPSARSSPRRPAGSSAMEGHPVNKGNLPLLWKCFHITRICCRPFRGRSGSRAGSAPPSSKPVYFREGANVALVSGGVTLVEQHGPYGAEGSSARRSRHCRILGTISSGRQLARRPSGAVRTVDPRGRESDHRQWARAFCRTRFWRIPSTRRRGNREFQRQRHRRRDAGAHGPRCLRCGGARAVPDRA